MFFTLSLLLQSIALVTVSKYKSRRSWLLGTALALSSNVFGSLLAILFFPTTTLALSASLSIPCILVFASFVLAPSVRIWSLLSVTGGVAFVYVLDGIWLERYLDRLATFPVIALGLAFLYTVSRLHSNSLQ